jgi:hypothetical protein
VEVARASTTTSVGDPSRRRTKCFELINYKLHTVEACACTCVQCALVPTGAMHVFGRIDC